VASKPWERMVTGHDDILHHRIVPRRRAFRIEAVSSDGAVELISVSATEDEAVQLLRLLQIESDRAVLQALAIEDGPKGPRGKIRIASIVGAP
jgi:hypothetical protein